MFLDLKQKPQGIRLRYMVVVGVTLAVIRLPQQSGQGQAQSLHQEARSIGRHMSSWLSYICASFLE